MQTVSFTSMSEGTAPEYEFLDRLEKDYIASLPDRIIQALERSAHTLSGYRVSRLTHALQSATRAYRAGESDELVVAALLHDIGDELAPCSHSELAAAVLRPYVSEKTYWIVKHHGLFQMYYYAHHCGGDRHARGRFKDHPWYDDAVKFCEFYDQNCFDPDYDSLDLAFFEPMLHRVLGKPTALDYEQQARYGNEASPTP